MKKLLYLFLFSIISYTHTIIVSVEDDPKNLGGLLISATTDNGESAANEEVYILSDIAYDGDEEVFEEEGGEDFHGKLILFKGNLDENEKLEIPKPAIKRYTVLVFAGIDHAFAKKGITLKKEEEENWKKLLEKNKEKLSKYYDLMQKKF